MVENYSCETSPMIKTKKIWNFTKIPTVVEPRDHQLEEEILSQKIALISELKKNIENEKHINGSKSLTVREKNQIKKQSFDIINTCCNLQQNWWNDVVMDIYGLILYEVPPVYVLVSATEGQSLSFCSSLRP